MFGVFAVVFDVSKKVSMFICDLYLPNMLSYGPVRNHKVSAIRRDHPIRESVLVAARGSFNVMSDRSHLRLYSAVEMPCTIAKPLPFTTSLRTCCSVGPNVGNGKSLAVRVCMASSPTSL